MPGNNPKFGPIAFGTFLTNEVITITLQTMLISTNRTSACICVHILGARITSIAIRNIVRAITKILRAFLTHPWIRKPKRTFASFTNTPIDRTLCTIRIHTCLTQTNLINTITRFTIKTFSFITFHAIRTTRNTKIINNIESKITLLANRSIGWTISAMIYWTTIT